MNQLKIYYFSGTGNAKQTTQWIGEVAQKKGIPVQIVNLAEKRKDNRNDFAVKKKSLIGFCYPTHGFNAPPIVLDYLYRFPSAKKLSKENGLTKIPRVFFANTRAGMKLLRWHTPGLSGIALWLPALILFLKGYHIVSMFSVDLPSNWISLHPGLNKKSVLSITRHWKKKVLIIARKMIHGKKIFKVFLDFPLDLLVFPIAVLYYFIGRFALAKTYIATHYCSMCGACIRHCPVSAIHEKNGRPYWSYHCESCMQCMNNCPHRAIENPHGILILLWWFLFAWLPNLFIALLSHWNFFQKALNITGNSFWYYFFMIFFGMPLLFFSYRVLHFSMRYRWVASLVRFASLTHFPFWRRYRALKNIKKI